MFDDKTVRNLEKKKCVNLFFVSFTNFKGIQGFYIKNPGYFQDSRSQNKFQAFQGFQGALGTLYIHNYFSN